MADEAENDMLEQRVVELEAALEQERRAVEALAAEAPDCCPPGVDPEDCTATQATMAADCAACWAAWARKQAREEADGK